jgi:S1-C subfamily serine protease
MKRLLLAALSALLLANPALPAKPKFLDSVRPLQALLPVVMQTDEGDYRTGAEALRNICTTTSINAHYWLTAAHCVADLDKKALDAHLRYIDGHLADVAQVSFDGDMAVLITQDYELPAVKFASMPPTWLDPLLIAGHPFGYDAVFVTQGTVANPYAKLEDGYYMLFNVAAAPGNSGSCVFNQKGEVVSILQVGWGRGFSPVSGGAPYWHLRQFARKYFKN